MARDNPSQHGTRVDQSKFEVPLSRIKCADRSGIPQEKPRLSFVFQSEARVQSAARVEEDPLAAIGSGWELGRSPTSNVDIQVGDPLILCEVGRVMGLSRSLPTNCEEQNYSDCGPNSGPDPGTKILLQRTCIRVETTEVPPSLECQEFDNTNFSDESVMPTLTPPAGFLWQFVAGGWALKPVSDRNVGAGIVLLRSEIDTDKLPPSSEASESPDHSFDSVLSSDFERNMRKLLPDLQRGSDASEMKHSQRARRSERPKKPSSRFTEDAGFVAEPPHSVKKKVTRNGPEEGMTSKPLLISDWSNAQLACYCDSCGVSFTDFAFECLNHLHSFEQSRMSLSWEVVATSSWGRVA